MFLKHEHFTYDLWKHQKHIVDIKTSDAFILKGSVFLPHIMAGYAGNLIYFFTPI